MLEGRALTRVEAIVVDLDDTVFDAGAWNVAALRHGAVERGMLPSGVERAMASFLEKYGPHDPALYHAILLGCGQSDCVLNVRALHEAALSYRGQGLDWDPFPGVREALIELSWHYRLVLLAEGPVEVQKAKLRALGIERLFEHVFYSDELEAQSARRPDPRHYQLLRERLGLAGRQILFVADNPQRDFKEARNQGFLTCRVYSGAWRSAAYADASARADYETTSLARLPELLAKSQRSQGGYEFIELPFMDQVRPRAEVATAAVAGEGQMPLELQFQLPAAAGILPFELPPACETAEGSPDLVELASEALVLLPEPPPTVLTVQARPRPARLARAERGMFFRSRPLRDIRAESSLD